MTVPLSRRILASIAARQGMKPTATADDRDALRQLHVNPFRLVLIDCQMPGVDSFDLASEIREHETFSDFPSSCWRLRANSTMPSAAASWIWHC